ncbi:MAG: hypothetical protein VKJ27_06450 [Synechocystis sp.]|nr:hypothetical protein [Synechocystis sp.]
MPTNIANTIGRRGERIFELAMTNLNQFNIPRFNPGSLGEKWPGIDYYVELCGVQNAVPFFFVQVKTTQKLIGDKRLDIRVNKQNCESLFKITAPTYLAGVHEPTKRVFILSVNTRPSKGIYHIPLQYELTSKNLDILHQEVLSFWKTFSYKPSTSHFL